MKKCPDKDGSKSTLSKAVIYLLIAQCGPGHDYKDPDVWQPQMAYEFKIAEVSIWN